MSLISDALKKAQQEREKRRGEHREPQPVVRGKLYSNKRLLIYTSLVFIILLTIVVFTIVFRPMKEIRMESLHISNNQPPVRTAVKKEPSTVNQQMLAVDEKSETQPIESPKLKEITRESLRDKKETITEEKKTDAVFKKEGTPIFTKIPAEKIEKINEKVKQQKPIEENSIEELIRQGNQFMGEMNYLLAVEKYKAALNEKKSAPLYLSLYRAFKSMKNMVLARAYIDDGLKHFPTDFYLNKISTILYLRSRDYIKALNNVKIAINKNPNDFTLFTYRGLCYFHTKEYARAMVNFQKSLELNSDAVENYYYIGLIFDNKKQYQKALEYYHVFYRLNPDNKNFKHREWIVRRRRELQEYLISKERQ